jgi:hypothetical protein
MKANLFKTILIFGMYSVPIAIISKSVEIFTKYQSLAQFDNTEASFQLLNQISNITYANYFLILGAIFSLLEIWANPKNNQPVTK